MQLQRGGKGDKRTCNIPAQARARRYGTLVRYTRGAFGRYAPRNVVKRADEVLKALEERKRGDDSENDAGEVMRGRIQRGARTGRHADGTISTRRPVVVSQIREEIVSPRPEQHPTPIEALNKLSDIKRLLGGNSRRSTFRELHLQLFS